MKDKSNIIEAVDQIFMKSKVADKYNFFYVIDPNPETLDDMEDLFGKPFLLLMGTIMTPVGLTNRDIFLYQNAMK